MGSSALIKLHLGAVDHDVLDGQTGQIEHAAEHVAVALLHAAFLVLQIDGAAQFLMRRQDVGLVVFLGRRQLEQLPHDEFDGDGHRRQQPDDGAHDRRHQQRHTVGTGEGQRLGKNGREDDDQDRDDRRGVGDAGRPDQIDRERGRQRRRHDIDERIADQHGADQFLGRRQQPIDQPRLLVALAFERVHARPGRGRQRRLAHVEEPRQQEQHGNGRQHQDRFEGGREHIRHRVSPLNS